MRIVVAPDKFRGSLSAAEAARALARGARQADPSADVIEIPMADGGEGTVDALVAATGGTILETIVSGPLGAPITARFGLLGDGQSAVLEMASASGLALLDRNDRDPMRASSRGTGELLLAAIRAGAKRVILGIGGSASNDGGAGFAQAIGYRLLDPEGVDLPPGGGSLSRLDRIDAGSVDPRIHQVAINVACDVDNPMCGPRGASTVFGPQKGADPRMIDVLDRNLSQLAAIIARDLGKQVASIPGAGAAGGLGAGLLAFAGASLEAGVDLVARAVDLDARIRGADLVLTGEGAIDASSGGGKTAVGVARIAKSWAVPTIGIAGTDRSGCRVRARSRHDRVFQPLRRAHVTRRRDRRCRPSAFQGRRSDRSHLPRGPLLRAMRRIAIMGEFDLIAVFRAGSEAHTRVRIGIGDDCASLRFTPGREVLVTTDMLMDGRHFRLSDVTPEQVGYKAMAVNLSDVAAMAGEPIAAVVAVALPRAIAVAIAPRIHTGLLEAARPFGVAIVGGDTNAWDGPLVLSVTLLGEVDAGQAVRRGGARIGDSIFVTGPLGGSLLGRHLRPMPRIAIAKALVQLGPIHAMIDVSDGLAADLGHILEESGGLGATLDADAIPIHPDAHTMAAFDGRSALDHALNDGEDFELVFTVSNVVAERIREVFKEVREIGTILQQPGLRLRFAGGEVREIIPKGFDHLREGPSA